MEDGDKMFYFISYFVIGLIYGVCSYKHTVKLYFKDFQYIPFTIGDFILYTLVKIVTWPIVSFFQYTNISFTLYKDREDFLQHEQSKKLLKSAKKYLK